MAKHVEKLLRGGNDTAAVKVKADVCVQCGERYYTDEIVTRFERICEQLQRQDPAGLTPIGRLYAAKAG